jgi:hypothetical protein
MDGRDRPLHHGLFPESRFQDKGVDIPLKQRMAVPAQVRE